MRKQDINLKATTVWLESGLMERLRDYAYTERISVRKTVSTAIEEYLKDKRVIKRPER